MTVLVATVGPRGAGVRVTEVGGGSMSVWTARI